MYIYRSQHKADAAPAVHILIDFVKKTGALVKLGSFLIDSVIRKSIALEESASIAYYLHDLRNVMPSVFHKNLLSGYIIYSSKSKCF